MKKKINLENILCVFIILCPILDIVSFVFRNVFNTNFSPSTIARPIIPLIVMLYLFIKKEKKYQKNIIIAAFIYFVYAVVHIIIFIKMKTGISYSNEAHELQYLINYTFMIVNLIAYITVFKDIGKLRKSVLIASAIYIGSIFIAIITRTSSNTYIEGIGYKGWFESGNSISAIMLLTMFLYLDFLKDKKYKWFVITVLTLVGIFMCLLIGTRVGLFGYILVIGLYVVIELLFNIIKNKKVSKKVLGFGLGSITLIIIIVIIFGSNTLKRRKHLESIEENIVDTSKAQEAHVTGNILEIKEKIDKGEIEEGYMSEAQKQSFIDLYNIANKLNVTNNNYRKQQLIYNLMLVKNQKNPILILFGNGYMTNYFEMVFEMELVAVLLNFGIIGFLIYLGPFLAILILGIYKGIKFRKKVTSDYVFLLFGLAMAFALSFFSGYTFFNSSTMMFIVAIATTIYSKLTKLIETNKEEKLK